MNPKALDIKAPFDMEAYLKEQYSLLIEDPLLLRYLSEYQLSVEDVASNVPMFKKLVDELKLCRSCGGLKNCTHIKKGFISIVIKNRLLDHKIIACKYMKAYEETQKRLAHYKYKELKVEERNVTIENTLNNIDKYSQNDTYIFAIDKIGDYCKKITSKGLYLYGACGVGKTCLALCIINYYANENKSVAFVNVPELILDMKSKLDYSKLNEIAKTDIVVFDDIGQEIVNSQSRDEILFVLLNERMLNKKATCFTSNFKFNDLKKHFEVNQYGDVDEMKAQRIMERIKALSEEFEISGKSLR